MMFSNKAENSDHWSYEIFYRGLEQGSAFGSGGSEPNRAKPRFELRAPRMPTPGSEALKQKWKNLFEVLVAAESDVRFQELVSCLSILYEVDENYIQSDFDELKKLVSTYSEPSRSSVLNITKKSGVFHEQADSFFGYGPLVNPSKQLLNSTKDTSQQTFRLGFPKSRIFIFFFVIFILIIIRIAFL